MLMRECGLAAALTVLALGAGREAAPDFTLRDTSGQPVTVKGYRGAVLWITFGATW